MKIIPVIFINDPPKTDPMERLIEEILGRSVNRRLVSVSFVKLEIPRPATFTVTYTTIP